ncbi:MAG TPA: hypothetical protein VGM82_05220 [Gemmatimonadaceae bacterium]|jgi:hypothetical protein
MFRRTTLLAALVILPLGSAAAQRTRSEATKHEDAKYADDGTAKGPAIRGRDLEDLSPLKLLIDKRKDLKLSDAQIDGLKKSDDQLKQKNQPLYKAIDSLAKAMRPAMNSSAEGDARIRDARRGLDDAIQSIRSNYDAAGTEAIGSFDADQKAKAGELFTKLKDDADKRIRDRMKVG